jgi:hypothetical protein
MKLRKSPLFSAVVGALTLTAALAPNASATRELEYFNFEGVVGVTPGTFNSVPAPGPGGLYPFLQNSTITNVTFPPGQLALAPGQGTTMNQLTGDVPTTNTALDAMGNDTPATGAFCYQFGANTFTTNNIYTSLSLSFALNSVSGSQPHSTSFDTLQLFYATVANPTAGDFTQIGSDIAINQNAGYYVITQPLPAGTLQQANLTLEFCFSGADNSAGGAHTYIDNIRLTATVVPEPSSYIGGLIGILGLCWFQRRWLVRSLPFRRA